MDAPILPILLAQALYPWISQSLFPDWNILTCPVMAPNLFPAGGSTHRQHLGYKGQGQWQCQSHPLSELTVEVAPRWLLHITVIAAAANRGGTATDPYLTHSQAIQLQVQAHPLIPQG